MAGLRAYKGFALESGLSPWAGDALIAFNAHQNGLRGDLADDTIAARLTHVGAFFRWAYGYQLTLITTEMVKDILDKPTVKQLSPRDMPDPKEVKAMLKAAKSPREHALIRVLADGGLRVYNTASLKSQGPLLRWLSFKTVGQFSSIAGVEASAGLLRWQIRLKARLRSLLNKAPPHF